MDDGGIGEDLHDGVRRDRLTRARLAHDAEDLAALEVKGHAVDGLDLTCVGKEGGAKISDFK